MRRKNLYFRKFGFELEFSTQFDDVEPIVKRLLGRVYNKKKITISKVFGDDNNHFRKWELKYDGSTESELTTPISTLKNFSKISKIIQGLKEKNLKITQKDSVHVHMQANDVPKHNIIAAWIQIESAILQCFPKHRRNNSYCEKIIKNKRYDKISDFFIKAEDESFNHHSIVSLQYYPERKTVEFRVMEGNLNQEDIKAWIRFCMIFLHYAKTIDPVEIICDKVKNKMNLDKMMAMMSIEDQLVIEFLERRKKLFRS